MSTDNQHPVSVTLTMTVLTPGQAPVMRTARIDAIDGTIAAAMVSRVFGAFDAGVAEQRQATFASLPSEFVELLG